MDDSVQVDFEYAGLNFGLRLVDVQFWSSTEYVGTTMNGDPTAFGVNFADGRIKGYPIASRRGGRTKTYYVFYVRGNPKYGTNDFDDNDDNCPTTPNTDQADIDEDGEGDVCDLDDGTIHVRFGASDRVEWQEEQGYESWNRYRGNLAVLLATGGYSNVYYLSTNAMACNVTAAWRGSSVRLCTASWSSGRIDAAGHDVLATCVDDRSTSRCVQVFAHRGDLAVVAQHVGPQRQVGVDYRAALDEYCHVELPAPPRAAK